MPDNVFSRPLRGTPLGFRVVFVTLIAAFLAGLVLLSLLDPVGLLGGLLSRPGFLALVALVVLTDLYPLVPWLVDVRDDRVFIWSASLSLAAMLAYGPWAVALFPISGALANLRKPDSRWWRLVANSAMFGLQGVLCAWIFIALRLLLQGPPPAVGQRPPLVPWQLLLVGLLLAVFLLVSNGLMLGLASVRLGVSTPRLEARMWLRRVPVVATSLVFSPLFAELALVAAELLPMLAAGILGVHQVEGAMHRTVRRARTDPLTGLANRASLLHNLALLVSSGDERDIAVLVIDLDGFKLVNDTYGHPVGDEVLVAVARRLDAAVRPPALVARYGGDEFVVVLGVGVPDADVKALVARLAAAMEEPVQAAGQLVRISASIGIAVGSGRGSTPMALIGLADRAMYRTKTAPPPVVPDPLWSASGFELSTGTSPVNLAPARALPALGLGNELLGFES